MDNIPRGIVLILLSIFFFVSLDTTAKLMTEAHPPLQVAWGRYLFSVLLLPLLIRPRAWRTALVTRRPGLQVVRSILLVSMTCGFFITVSYIPLADAVAIGFAAPFITTALAIPVLGEKVGIRRWMAILVGFIGVLVVLRPGFEERHWAYFLPLGVALVAAIYNVLTRLVNRYDSAQTSIAFNNMAGVVVMSIVVLTVPGVWSPLGAVDWAMLVLVGGFAMAGHFCLVLAYRNAPVSALAPFTFSHMVLAIIAGLIVFGDVPDWPTLLGAAIIAGSGIYVFHREAVRAREARMGATALE
ncbi:MAG: DMT family transporter [Rhodospirillales bacterium]|nr:DMT family transporter [Rhodospirillales bacterium]